MCWEVGPQNIRRALQRGLEKKKTVFEIEETATLHTEFQIQKIKKKSQKKSK